MEISAYLDGIETFFFGNLSDGTALKPDLFA